VDIWEALLNINIEIIVDATFAPLAENVLGSAGGSFVSPDFSPNALPGFSYILSLADQVAGFDLCPLFVPPCDTDIVAEFSSSESDWYFGTDANPGPGQIDFVTVVLHELGHGLGFIGSFGVADLSTLEITHFGSGGGLQSDVVVFNPSSTASASGEVNFFDQDGTPLDSSGFLPGGNSFMLSPLGSATLSTTGAGSTVITGSATVASDTPISAVIRFDITGSGWLE